MERGLLFDVERFSTKDGPGIRTVVFFKGCNMNCLWCHNPEGIHSGPELLCRPELCIGCGSCAEVCPTGAHTFSGNSHGFDTSKCRQCLKCADVCFSGAVKACGRTMSADELMEEILRDRLIYEKSGGGVTLTGGEVMMQHEFAAELARRCAENGIATAIETNLSLPWSRYEPVLKSLNMVFADIKHVDSTLHREWTGIGNETILENLRRLDRSGLPYVIRTPIVPGFNDNEETVSAIARILRDMKKLEYYELLTYNPLGASKGKLINPPALRSYPIPKKAEMRELAAAAAGFVPTRLDGSRYT